VRLFLAVFVLVSALVALGGLLLATAASGGGNISAATTRAPGSTSTTRPQHLVPPATTTPQSPAIFIASSGVFDMPDPFLLTAGGKDYLYLSNSFGDKTKSNIPVLVGTPGHFGPITDALPVVPSWALSNTVGANTWDPYVVHLGNHYILYSAPTIKVDPIKNPVHCISAAVSDSPAGPFVPYGTAPLACQPQLGGDIDAQLVDDPTGPRGPTDPYYLIWKSDNNNLPGSGPCTIWEAPMQNNGLSLAGNPAVIFRPTQAWEAPVLEAPQMVRAPDGDNWLFFSSGDGYYTPRYDIGVVKCGEALQPCIPSTARLLVGTNAQGDAPGEETVFTAPDNSVWLLYNPWHSRIPLAPLRPVAAVRIGWDDEGPYVAEAGAFPSP